MDILNKNLNSKTTWLIIGAIVSVELWPYPVDNSKSTFDAVPDNSHTPNEMIVYVPVLGTNTALASGSTIYSGMESY